MNSNVKLHSKRVNLVSLKLVRESSLLYENRKITSASHAASFIKPFLEDCDREKLIVCCLDTKNQPNSIQVVSIGSLNASIVHPREVFKVAILSNANSIIVFHNHPSGNTTPSSEDFSITKRLQEAGNILGVTLLDHIIIGSDNSYYSFKEHRDL